MTWVELVAAFVGGNVTNSVAMWLLHRRRAKTDAAAALVGVAERVTGMVEARLLLAEQEIAQLRAENAELRVEIQRLRERLEDAE